MKTDLSQPDIRDKIIQRLKFYLSRDETGIRHTVLDLLLRERRLTAYELYTYVNTRYGTTYKQVVSMLGVMSSRFGIITAKRESYKEAYVYILKDKYLPELKQVLGYRRYYTRPQLVQA